MGKIHTYPTTSKVFVEDISVAVHIARLGVINGYHDASRILKATTAQVDAACQTGKNGAMINGARVRLATLPEVRDAFPEYRPVSHRKTKNPSLAIPTRVTVKVGNKKHHFFHRSMTSARIVWELSLTQFEKIAEKKSGWKELRPGCLVDIKVGEEPTGNRDFHVGESVGKLFKLTLRKSGSVGVTYIGPSSFPDVESVPMMVLNNAE